MKRVGITFPTALLTYTHGNNVGSLHFVWRVETFGDGAFSDSQPVIESIKKDIPVYHTRLMRKKMFKVFGRLTSSLKPAFARYIYRVFTGMAVHQYVSCRFKVHFISYCYMSYFCPINAFFSSPLNTSFCDQILSALSSSYIISTNHMF